MCIILFIVFFLFYLLSSLNTSHHNLSALRVRKLIRSVIAEVRAP